LGGAAQADELEDRLCLAQSEKTAKMKWPMTIDK